MASSKNSRHNRGATAKKRLLNGSSVTPVKIVGHWRGWGTYMGGEVDGNVIRDDSGRPLPLSSVGKVIDS